MPEINKTLTFQKSFFLLLFLYSGCFILLLTLETVLSNTQILSGNNLLNWDAVHYSTIMKDGYTTGMVAFFPLFPFIWSWLHLSPFLISIFNGLVFAISLAWLATEFNIQKKHLLLLASIPSIIFMFLPFSEAIFFLTTTIALIGYKKNNLWLTITGIFLSGLSRPVASIFIPAIILVEFLSSNKNRLSLQKITGLIGVALLSMFLVFLLQYIQTGQWFKFFEVQRNWNNYLRWPTFPLTSWAGGFIVKLDATPLFFGASALVLLLYLMIRKIKFSETILQDKALLLSICYVCLLPVLVLFTKGGVFNSFNRYLFSTSFFLLALNSFLESKIFNPQNLWKLILASSVFWLIFASYVHIQTLLKFEFLTLYLVILTLNTFDSKILKQTGFYATLSLNIVFMLILYHRFLSNLWVG